MKKTIVSILLALGACASAQAVYTGASIGYLVDSEEAYFAARFGTSLNSSESYVGNVEVEVGYTEESSGGVTAKLTPLMLNYRGEILGQSNWAPYYGAGAGLAKVKVSGFGISSDDTSFAAQAFAGVAYKASESASINLGARYIYVDDVKLFGTNLDVGDDVAVEVGFSFRF